MEVVVIVCQVVPSWCDVSSTIAVVLSVVVVAVASYLPVVVVAVASYLPVVVVVVASYTSSAAVNHHFHL